MPGPGKRMALNKHRPRRTADRDERAEAEGSSIVEDRAFLDLWTRHCFYVEDNPPNLRSTTMRILYTEYLRRIGMIIKRARTGEHWHKHTPFARDTLRLGDWIYHEPRTINLEDELLVLLTTYGITVPRAREIVGETHRRHRPPDAKARRESIRAYDLHLRGDTAGQIAKRLYPGEFKEGTTYPSRNPRERVRHRLKAVERLIADLGLSIPPAN